jgi:hypothetical protein
MFVSGYQSIDMRCIVVPVKFEGGLSISFLRKKQPFTKKRGSKVYICKKVRFLVVNFATSCPVFRNPDGQLILKFCMEQETMDIYQKLPNIK